MAVYVDRPAYHYGRMVMCHMIADTPDELHAMVDRIGVNRRWFQTPPAASFWHYDIAKVKRALAIVDRLWLTCGAFARQGRSGDVAPSFVCSGCGPRRHGLSVLGIQPCPKSTHL